NYAGDEGEQLVSIEAHGVHSDGTVDLTIDNKSYVNYNFQRLMKDIATRIATENANTSSTSTDVAPFYRLMTVKISKPGQEQRNFEGSSSDTFTSKGMAINHLELFTSDQSTVPAPTCSFADLWQIASRRDAPASAVATILYDDQGYHFSIDGMS